MATFYIAPFAPHGQTPEQREFEMLEYIPVSYTHLDGKRVFRDGIFQPATGRPGACMHGNDGF